MKPTINIIVAKAENNVIGNKNQLIWHLPNDLKRFKQLTTGHPIIMGRKTFESIGKPLPNRTNIVITRNTVWTAEGIVTVHSLEDAIQLASRSDSEIFIIGGGNIYQQALKLADVLEVTEVHQDFDGDAHFPEIDLNQWQETFREKHPTDEKHSIEYSFVTYIRKKG